MGWGGDGCLDWHCLNCHCLNCDLGGFGGWAVICAWGREFGVGRGRVSGLALSEL